MSLASPAQPENLPPEPPPNESGLAVVRHLFSENEFDEAMRVANLVPLSSPDAAEVTQLMVGYHLWMGRFFEARQLLAERVRLGVPETPSLKVRRWQIGQFFLLGDVADSSLVSQDLSPESFPEWASWSRLLFLLLYSRSDGLKLLEEMAEDPLYQARLLADPTMQATWKSLLPQAEISTPWAAILSKPAKSLLAIKQPYLLAFGLNSYHGLSSRFPGLLALDLLRDCVFLHPTTAREKPELYAEFLQWFTQQAGQTRSLLTQLENRQDACRVSSLHELAVAHTMAGMPSRARDNLLELAALDVEKFRLTARDPRLHLLCETLEQIEQFATLAPEYLESLAQMEHLRHEPERLQEALSRLPSCVQAHPLVRRLQAIAAQGLENPTKALELLEGLDSDFDPDWALLRAVSLFSLEGFDEFWDEISTAPPTIAVHPFVDAKGYFRDFLGEKTALFELLGRLPETDPEKLLPGKGRYAIYLTINSNQSLPRNQLLPRRKYLLYAREDSLGGAVRSARGLLREALLAVGETLYSPEAFELKSWLKIIGLRVQITPDLRPHFLFDNQLESLLPSVIEELAEAEETASTT